MNKKISRKEFIKTATSGLTGLALAGTLPFGAFGQVLGANDRLNVAVMGVNSRGAYLAVKFAEAENTRITYICDVDSRAMDKTIQAIDDQYGYKPKGEKDIRKVLEDKDLDILVIATPDHWHAPASIMALKAGKHVYVEKPSSHNPHEGALLVQAQKKSGKLVQMGNQQRSAYETIEGIQLIHDGIIGNAYYGKAWYAASRGSIGYGKPAQVPEWLDWDLFQGPAPRTTFRDNLVHYNWHWFWDWGTGEILNNGTHEVDICRWALGVAYPNRVSSSGGRYCFKDDWEFYDTQITNYDYDGGKTINWEGRSCNSNTFHNRGRGSIIYGTEGTVILDRSGYEVYNLKNELVKEAKTGTENATMNIVGGGDLEKLHINNFLDGIRNGTPLNSAIDEGNISVTICLLGNIAQETGRTLQLDTQNGQIINDQEAMKMWSRQYEPGWEPVI